MKHSWILFSAIFVAHAGVGISRHDLGESFRLSLISANLGLVVTPNR